LVIDRLRDQISTTTDKQPVLFYYFDYKDQANQSLDMFARSLLKQLLCTGNSIPQEVQAFYDDWTKRSGSPDFATLSCVLESCSTRFSTIYLVLDALDEYQQKLLKKLVSFLCKLESAKGSRFKILCTTRPHLSHLAKELKASETLEIQPDNPDVENYIKWRLDEEWEHDEDLKTDVLQAVIGQNDIEYGPHAHYPRYGSAHADRLRFLLVRYQLDQILSEDDPQDALNLKNQLNSAYRIFSWLYHMPRPMRMGELIEALSIQKGNIELNPKLFISSSKLLKCCEGLVTYDRMSDEMRFAHFTVYEYLQKLLNYRRSIT
jgi:hypothetical protein